MCLQCHSTCDWIELSRESLPVVFRHILLLLCTNEKCNESLDKHSKSALNDCSLLFHCNTCCEQAIMAALPFAGVCGGRIRWAEPPEQRGVLRLLLQPLDWGGSPEGGCQLPGCHQLCGQALCHRGWPWWQHLFWQGQWALWVCIFYPQQTALLV